MVKIFVLIDWANVYFPLTIWVYATIFHLMAYAIKWTVPFRQGAIALQKDAVQQAADDGSDLADNNRCNNTALRKATRRVSQLYDAELAAGGVRNTQRSILFQIARQGSPTLSELAASLVLDKSALGNNLKPLEREGLIAVEVDPSDKRSRLATLTKRGQSTLKKTEALWAAAQERFENKFGVAKAKALRKTLAQIAATDFGDVPKSRQADSVGMPSVDENRCNITALKKSSRRVSQFYDSLLAPTGLRATQRSILRTIARLGSPTLGELAIAMVLDRSALGHNLRPLERDGFIVLVVDPADKRSRLAKLTPLGQRKLREAGALWQLAQERFENEFGVEKSKALRVQLASISADKFDEA